MKKHRTLIKIERESDLSCKIYKNNTYSYN